jgi:hypothetical protein
LATKHTAVWSKRRFVCAKPVLCVWRAPWNLLRSDLTQVKLRTNEAPALLSNSLNCREYRIGVITVLCAFYFVAMVRESKHCWRLSCRGDLSVIISPESWLKSGYVCTLTAAVLALTIQSALAQIAAPSSKASREAEMKASAAITTKVLAIGTWTAKATPETRPPIMPSEARDTLRLQLQGKIDQWFAKADGSGAVFLMNVTTAAEAHALLEQLPLGRAGMMTFELIPIGPLWPLALLLGEPAK